MAFENQNGLYQWHQQGPQGPGWYATWESGMGGKASSDPNDERFNETPLRAAHAEKQKSDSLARLAAAGIPEGTKLYTDLQQLGGAMRDAQGNTFGEQGGQAYAINPATGQLEPLRVYYDQTQDQYPDDSVFTPTSHYFFGPAGGELQQHTGYSKGDVIDRLGAAADPYIAPLMMGLATGPLGAISGLTGAGLGAATGGLTGGMVGGDLESVLKGGVVGGLGGAAVEYLGGSAPVAGGAIDWGGLDIPVSAGQQGALGTGALPGLENLASLLPQGSTDLPSVTVPQSAPTPTVDLTTGASTGATAVGGVAPGGAMDMTGSINSPTGTGLPGTVFDAGGALGLGLPAVDGGAAATAISRILDGTATTADWLSVAGAAAPGVLGAIGANEQAGSLEALAREYMAFGAPSRGRFEGSFAPGFKLADMPGFQESMDTSANSLARALSVQGNPFDSPSAQAEIMKYVTGNVALPALSDYRRLNAAAGGLANFAPAAVDASGAAIGAGANVFSNLGGAAANVFAPPKKPKLSDILSLV